METSGSTNGNRNRIYSGDLGLQVYTRSSSESPTPSTWSATSLGADDPLLSRRSSSEDDAEAAEAVVEEKLGPTASSWWSWEYEDGEEEDEDDEAEDPIISATSTSTRGVLPVSKHASPYFPAISPNTPSIFSYTRVFLVMRSVRHRWSRWVFQKARKYARRRGKRRSHSPSSGRTLRIPKTLLFLLIFTTFIMVFYFSAESGIQGLNPWRKESYIQGFSALNVTRREHRLVLRGGYQNVGIVQFLEKLGVEDEGAMSGSPAERKGKGKEEEKGKKDVNRNIYAFHTGTMHFTSLKAESKATLHKEAAEDEIQQPPEPLYTWTKPLSSGYEGSTHLFLSNPILQNSISDSHTQSSGKVVVKRFFKSTRADAVPPAVLAKLRSEGRALGINAVSQALGIDELGEGGGEEAMSGGSVLIEADSKHPAEDEMKGSQAPAPKKVRRKKEVEWPVEVAASLRRYRSFEKVIKKRGGVADRGKTIERQSESDDLEGQEEGEIIKALDIFYLPDLEIVEVEDSKHKFMPRKTTATSSPPKPTKKNILRNKLTDVESWALVLPFFSGGDADHLLRLLPVLRLSPADLDWLYRPLFTKGVFKSLARMHHTPEDKPDLRRQQLDLDEGLGWYTEGGSGAFGNNAHKGAGTHGIGNVSRAERVGDGERGYCHGDVKLDNMFVRSVELEDEEEDEGEKRDDSLLSLSSFSRRKTQHYLVLSDLSQVRPLHHHWHIKENWRDCRLVDADRAWRSYLSLLRMGSRTRPAAGGAEGESLMRAFDEAWMRWKGLFEERGGRLGFGDAAGKGVGSLTERQEEVTGTSKPFSPEEDFFPYSQLPLPDTNTDPEYYIKAYFTWLSRPTLPSDWFIPSNQPLSPYSPNTYWGVSSSSNLPRTRLLPSLDSDREMSRQEVFGLIENIKNEMEDRKNNGKEMPEWWWDAKGSGRGRPGGGGGNKGEDTRSEVEIEVGRGVEVIGARVVGM